MMMPGVAFPSAREPGSELPVKAHRLVPNWLSQAIRRHLLRRADLLYPQPAVLPTTGPLIHSLPSAHVRSCVTHAVLGSEATGLHSLPAELLLHTFSNLDPHSLCQLACTSTTCRAYADCDLVWLSSPAARAKEAERLRWLHATALYEEQVAAQAFEWRQKMRQRKRRLLAVLQAVCGILVVMVPLILRHGRVRDDRIGAAKTAAGALATTLSSAPPSLEVQGVVKVPYEQIVWAACGGSRGTRLGAAHAAQS